MTSSKYRDEWLAKGLCGQCGRNPKVEGKNYCTECIEYKRRKRLEYRDKNRKLGLCQDCRQPVYKESAYCLKCLTKKRNTLQEKRNSYKENALCTMCGRPRFKHYSLCKICLDRKLKPKETFEVFDQETQSSLLVTTTNYAGTEIDGMNVLEYSYKNKNHHYWLCQCKCGNIFVASQNQLSKGFNRCECSKG